MGAISNANEIAFSIRSGCIGNTCEPFVEVQIHGEEVLMSPELAQEFALCLQQVAEAALAAEDVFLIKFVKA